jgi:uncharacterized membrane protein YphA (DoxX/SURF4 family)
MGEPLSSSDPARSPARRLFFRFSLVYFLLYGLEIVLHLLASDRWVGAESLGSWDRALDYRWVLGSLVLAVLAALIWTGVERDGRDRGVEEGLRISLRHTLALLLLSYGALKMLQMEIPFPPIERLQERIGDSSPFTLYAVFLGYSAPYAFFTGSLSVVAGLLLLARKTTTLGALLALGVFGNEGMLAFCYDVPTKLLSIHALLLALFLLAPDAGRLRDGLLLGRPTRPAKLSPPPGGERGRRAVRQIQIYLVVLALLPPIKHSLDLPGGHRSASRTPLYGVYEVEQFLRGDQTVPDWSDRTRWQRVIVPSRWELQVQLADGSSRSFATGYVRGSVRLSSQTTGGAGGNLPQGTLAYTRPDPDHLLLSGELAGDSLRLVLRRIDRSKYLLISRK